MRLWQVSMLAFGLADNYAAAVCARLIGGFFNCAYTCGATSVVHARLAASTKLIACFYVIASNLRRLVKTHVSMLLALCRNVRSMIGESTGFTSQAIAFGYLGLAQGLGTVLGPLIGGSLASPCDSFGPRFPLCAPGQLNDARPFLLPCLGAALVSAFATLSNTIVLRETLPAIVEARRAKQQAAAGEAASKQPLLAGRHHPDLEG